MVLTAEKPVTEIRVISYEPRCGHGGYVLRIHTHVNGVKQYKLMCVTCGQRGNAVPKSHDMVLDLWGEEPPEVDHSLSEQFYAEEYRKRQADREAEQQEKSNRWWTEYNQYLNSDKWRGKRGKVLARDGYKCQAAMHRCIGKATHVHHLTYDHVFNEPLFDLISVCEMCHHQITELDRKK